MKIKKYRAEWLRQDELVAIVGIETRRRSEVDHLDLERILTITLWLLVVKLELEIQLWKKKGGLLGGACWSCSSYGSYVVHDGPCPVVDSLGIPNSEGLTGPYRPLAADVLQPVGVPRRGEKEAR